MYNSISGLISSVTVPDDLPADIDDLYLITDGGHRIPIMRESEVPEPATLALAALAALGALAALLGRRPAG